MNVVNPESLLTITAETGIDSLNIGSSPLPVESGLPVMDSALLLLMVGIAVLAGLFTGKGAERIRIPMVVGYIIAGVIFGESGLGLIKASSTGLLTNIALGFIGFGIGSQLRLSVLKRLGSSIISISLLEAFGAFILVSVGVTLLTGKLYLGLIFGALASATAPAATVDVLEEYQSKGPLTTSLLAVVGIDDGIALLLFGFGISIATSLLGSGTTILEGLLRPLVDIGGSIILGATLGFLYSKVARWMGSRNETLILSVGVVVLACGAAEYLKLSLIMTNMIIGIVSCNLLPMKARNIQEAVGGFTPPIYVLFFVLVGARLNIMNLPQMGLIGVVYLLLRAIGKFGGAYIGSVISHAPEVVRKYLGLGLFSQAGVAVGLSLAAAKILDEAGHYDLSSMVINVIAATTFVVQIIGPPCTKIAIVKAGEVPEHMMYKLGKASKKKQKKK